MISRIVIGVVATIVSGLLYRMGGADQWKWCPMNQKLWRKIFIGLTLGICFAIYRQSWVPLLCLATYPIAVMCFNYGEKSWLNPLGENGKFFVVGFMLGLASFPIIWWVAIPQAIASGLLWVLLHKVDDKQSGFSIKNPWQEILRGVAGTWLMAFYR